MDQIKPGDVLEALRKIGLSVENPPFKASGIKWIMNGDEQVGRVRPSVGQAPTSPKTTRIELDL